MMMVPSLHPALRRGLVFALLAASLAAMTGSAEARKRRVHKLQLTTHTDPKVKHRIRPSARSSVFATSWGCNESTVDRAPYLSNAPQIKVIYAYPSGQSNQLATYDDMLQADAASVGNKVAAESGNTKSVRFDVGGTGGAADVCTNDARNRLDIQTVALDHDANFYAGDTFGLIAAELDAKLVPADPNQRVNYVVYLDNVHPTDGYSGQADLPYDTVHGYANSINQGRDGRGKLYALIYGYGGADFVGGDGDAERRITFLHELSHTLGAVQLNAPHSSGAGHCYDGVDVMCYDDGGSYFTGGGAMTFSCGGYVLDCNSDDYFDADPASGSFLAQNWNEFDSVFLCPVAECDTQLPSFPVSLTATHPNGHLTLQADAGAATVAHYEWNVSGDKTFEVDTGSTATLDTNFAIPGTRTVEVRAVKADGSFGYASTVLSIREPVPDLIVKGDRVVGATITLDGTGTSDPDGLIKDFWWDLDSNGTFETETGLERVAATSYPRAGATRAALQVDYGFGWAQKFVTFDIASSPGTALPGSPLTPTTPGATTTTNPPSLSSRNVTLARLRKSGLPLVIQCNAACTVQFALTVDAKTARRLHLKGKGSKPVVIGRVRGQFIAGTVKPVLKLSASARSALRKARSLKATLTGAIDQPPAKPFAITKTLSFKR